MPRSARWLALIPLAAAAPRGAAQTSSPTAPRMVGRLDGQSTTGYHWRGIRRSSGPVAQLDGAGGIEWGPVTLTAGIWSNVELRRSAPGRRSDLDPGDRGWTERDLWGQLAARLGDLTLSGGVIRSRYRRSAAEVTELYGTARLQDGRWSYLLSGWRAVDGATGTYLEPALSFQHAANPFAGPAIALFTTARVGIQAGRRSPGSIGSTPGAWGTGLTHLSLAPGARGTFPLVGPLAATAGLALELELRRDQATRVEPDGTKGSWFRIWLPIEIGLTFPYRRPK